MQNTLPLVDGESSLIAAPSEVAVPKAPQYAGLWQRFAAVFLDSLFMGLLYLGLLIVLMVIGPNPKTAPLANAILAIFLWAGYIALNIWFIHTKGGLPGKLALGLRIVDPTTGQYLSKWRAFFRPYATILSMIPLYLGFLWMLWDGKKQTFHDKLVRSVVIRVPDLP